MADGRRYLPIQQPDLKQILQEAESRWLRPFEICQILRNYQIFCLTPEPPSRPPAGSLFLFDRKTLRYFRKDGYCWRKKKDGKTISEAHEKLKAGSVDVLHCYYAHGEDNGSFQRRSYWMLDEQLKHIVLVHYREVKEGYKSGFSRLLYSEPLLKHGISQVSSTPCSVASNWTKQTLSSEFDDGDSGDDQGTSSCPQSVYGCSPHDSSLPEHQAAGFSELSRTPLYSEFGATFTQGACSSLWPQIHSSTGHVNSRFANELNFGLHGGVDIVDCKSLDSQLNANGMIQAISSNGSKHTPDKESQAISATPQSVIEVHREHDSDILHHQFQSHSDSQLIHNHQEGDHGNDISGELKNLDSFKQWMVKGIDVACDSALKTSDSEQYWNPIDSQDIDKEASSLSRQIQLDMDSMCPSLSQELLFSIYDFSPEWAYSGVETKVLITGKFLGDSKHPVLTKWCCMFGEIEVPAEVLTNNAIRCHAPKHASGRVPFYVTCCNRLVCSEVRQFEYREKPPQDALSLGIINAPEDELRLQIRLAKMLYSGLDRKWLDCSLEDCDKCKIKKCMINSNDEWEWIEAASVVFKGSRQNPKDALIQNLLEDRLIEWLICKLHEGGKGPNVWDEGGQGFIHLTAALGYKFAMSPIIAAGVSPNFRDAHGRTGLHWASFFGREEAVLALIRLGADPGAVDDPTSAFPGGQTAADLASSRGHKGIAGYLAEAHLIAHVSSLTNIRTYENVPKNSELVPSDNTDEQRLSLKGPLVAVQKSAHAAALIQSAFHARSFRHRQLTKSHNEVSGVSLDLVALGSLNKVHKMHHFRDYLHSAAMKIQQKYRGSRGRNEFLKICDHIVKIQAYVRGHQVRQQYKKVVWSVSIVEKVLLRWRRKTEAFWLARF